MSTRTRSIWAAVLAATSALLLVAALIDPLEGGIALLGAIALVVATRPLSGVAVPKLMWIPMTAAVVLGATVLSLVIFAVPQRPDDGIVRNPLNAGVIGLLWAYRVAVVIAIAGSVRYLAQSVGSARTPVEPNTGPPAG